MASHYTDPRDFILHIRNELITVYLKKRHDIDFAIAEKSETQEECADRFMAFMDAQDEKVRDKVFMELEYINSLSSENHIIGLCALAPHINRAETIENKAQNYDERALLAYINYPTEFDSYYSRAEIEELGVKELTLPAVIPTEAITSDKIKQFESQVQSIYRITLKGKECKIKVFRENKKLILRAYLEDLPTRDTVFNSGQLDEKHIRKPVFDAVFIYNPELKMLGVRALGGKSVVDKLQKSFCSHFLGIENIKTDEPRFSLASVNNLANLNLIADASHGVERAYLKSIRLKHSAIPHKLYIDVGGKDMYSGADAVQQILRELHLDTNSGWKPLSITITVIFKQIGKGRRKQISVSITPPNYCSLKNRQQDDVVRRLLKDWGIFVG